VQSEKSINTNSNSSLLATCSQLLAHWLGREDSNPCKQIQSLPSCLWTTPQKIKNYIISPVQLRRGVELREIVLRLSCESILFLLPWWQGIKGRMKERIYHHPLPTPLPSRERDSLCPNISPKNLKTESYQCYEI
jgi:hypothetical protein